MAKTKMFKGLERTILGMENDERAFLEQNLI